MTDASNLSQKSTKILTVVILIASAILLYGFFAGIRANFGIITTLLTQEIPGATYGEINNLFFIFTIVNGLATPIMGYLTIKKSNLFVLLLGCIFVAIGMAGIALSSSLIPLAVAVCFFMPVGSAALSFAVIFSLVAPTLGVKSAAVASGVINCSSTFFAMLLAPIIESLTATIGFTLCILLMGSMALILIPLSIYVSKKGKKDIITNECRHKIRFFVVCKKILQSPIFYVVLAFYILYGFCCQGVTNHLFADMVSFGIDGLESSFALSIANLSMTIGMLAIGIIAAKFRKHLRIGLIIIISITLIQILGCIIYEVPLAITIILILVCLLGGSILPLASLIASESIKPIYLATTLGILHFVGKISQGLNFQIGGAIGDLTGNLNYVFIIQTIVAVLITIFIVGIILFWWRKKSIDNKL